MKLNVIGIVGGVIAFVSLVLPWWTITMSTAAGLSFSESISIYPYQVTASAGGASVAVTVDIWYGGAALALVVLGGFLGIMGSLVRTTRLILVAGGLLALFSIIIFAAGLQSELSKSAFMSGWPAMGLFSSGTMGPFNYLNYTAYLSFGFWLALVSAIIMLVASMKKRRASPPPPPTPGLEKAVSEEEAGTLCLGNQEVA